jgi:hypothetical protein
VSQVPGPVIAGRRTINLIGEGLSVLVNEQGTRVPLSLTTMPGRRLASNLSNLSLAFDRYGAAFAVDTPTAVIDLSDRNTLPVHDVPDLATFKFEACDSREAAPSPPTSLNRAAGRDMPQRRSG